MKLRYISLLLVCAVLSSCSAGEVKNAEKSTAQMVET